MLGTSVSPRYPQGVKFNPRRVGGGGGGGGGGGEEPVGSSGGTGKSSGSGEEGGDGGSSSNGGGGGDSGPSNSSSSSVPISAGGTTYTATTLALGGTIPVTIPPGQLFAGRKSGGGTRAKVFGTSQYGSGYPNITQRGVDDRDFPYFFWPISWAGASSEGEGAYLHTSEYGRPDTSRPGGPLTTLTFVSGLSPNTTFRLVADNATTISLISSLQIDCPQILNSLNNGASSIFSVPYTDSSALPQPEQAIQYYRASTVALTLDGYNNTADFEPEGTPDVPLPINLEFDFDLLICLNVTIGQNVLLIDGAPGLVPNMNIIGLMYIIWSLSLLF